MGSVLLLALSIALAPPAPQCVVTTPIAVVYDTGDAENIVGKTLARACLEASDKAAFTLSARLQVTEAGFALALEAKDSAGKPLGRVTREATSPGAGEPREDILFGAARDALSVLRNKIGLGPATRSCKEQHEIVVLWHKSTSPDDRAEVTRALASRCVRIKDEVDGHRRMATDLASMLDLPLLAVKSAHDEDGALSVVADVVDPSTEQLTIKAHASEKGKESDVVIRRALDAVLPAL